MIKINDKKKNAESGITVIKLIIITFIIIFILSIFLIYFKTNISQKVSILYKQLTKKIDIELEIAEREILAGMTDVTGQGVEIEVLDGTDLIHQEDIVILIDELKNAGSQAISVNEQRIINSTYIYCDGTVILIDGQKIGNPFKIKAIGDKETIYGAINRNKGYIQTLKKSGITIEIEKSDNINISKTNKEIIKNYNTKNNLQKLYYLNRIIGKEETQGNGIEIKIEENSAKLTAVSFLQIINDLNAAGVTAISINEQRITNMTDAMDISSKYVLLNSVPVQAPYIIKAVGNQDKIMERLNYNNSYITKLKDKGNNIYIRRVTGVKIEKYIQKNDQDKMSINYLK